MARPFQSASSLSSRAGAHALVARRQQQPALLGQQRLVGFGELRLRMTHAAQDVAAHDNCRRG